jgi:glycosyl transferase, family 25
MRAVEAVAQSFHAPVEEATPQVDLLIISLRRSMDRRIVMTEEMKKAGLTARFFDAIDAAEIGRDGLTQRCKPAGRWGMLRQHDMACTLSHIDALKQFLSGGASHCLMMEDDVFVSSDLRAWLEDMSWWPADADVVKIDKSRKDNDWVVMGPVAVSHLGRDVRRLRSRHMGGAGYLVSRKGADKIVSYQPVDMPIDHLIFNMNASPLSRELVIYQVNPAHIKQGNERRVATLLPYSEVTETREKGMQYIRREIRRGFYEINRLHRQIGCLVFGGGVLRKPTWK